MSGDGFYGDAHVLISGHGCAQVEVFQIACHVSGARGGQDTIDVHFDGRHIRGLGGCCVWIVDFVAADCPPDTSWFWFFGSVGTDDAQVCSFAVLGHVTWVNEEDCVGAVGHFRVWTESLCQAADFIGIGVDPFVAVTTLAQFKMFGHVASIRIEGGAVEGGFIFGGKVIGGCLVFGLGVGDLSSWCIFSLGFSTLIGWGWVGGCKMLWISSSSRVRVAGSICNSRIVGVG